MKQIYRLAAALFFLPIGMVAQYSQGFDSDTMPTDWTIVNGGDPGTWKTWTASYQSYILPHSGSHFLGIAYNETMAHDDYAISPAIVVTAGVSDKLTFWGNNLGKSLAEKFDVKISTATPNVNDFTNTLASDVTPPYRSWAQYTYDLTPYVGQTIYIAFYSSTKNLWFVGIDDFEVSSNNLSVSEASLNKASIYPNPVKDVLNIKNKNKMSEVKIFDFSGKQLKKEILNSNSTTLDVSNLSTGNYILKIKEENIEKNYKIIKK